MMAETREIIYIITDEFIIVCPDTYFIAFQDAFTSL